MWINPADSIKLVPGSADAMGVAGASPPARVSPMTAHDVSIALFALRAIAFLLGFAGLPLWSCAICPAVEVIVWGIRRLNASVADDMKHAYLLVGLIFAVASVITWVGGRIISAWMRSAFSKPAARTKKPPV